MPGIVLLYDFSNEPNKSYSINIIANLAREGVAFEMAPKVEDEPVSLVIDGAAYNPDFIKENQADILKQIRKIKKSQLEEVLI